MEVVERGPCFSLAGLETDEKVVAAGVQKQVGDLRALEIVRLENLVFGTLGRKRDCCICKTVRMHYVPGLF